MFDAYYKFQAWLFQPDPQRPWKVRRVHEEVQQELSHHCFAGVSILHLAGISRSRKKTPLFRPIFYNKKKNPILRPFYI